MTLQIIKEVSFYGHHIDYFMPVTPTMYLGNSCRCKRGNFKRRYASLKKRNAMIINVERYIEVCLPYTVIQMENTLIYI
jgi:hypothetical protein